MVVVGVFIIAQLIKQCMDIWLEHARLGVEKMLEHEKLQV